MIRWLAAFLLVPVLASAQEAFQLPSGNIHCAVFDGLLRCEVLNFTYPRPARPRGCEQDWGGAVELAGKGAAVLLCHGDTVANPAAPAFCQVTPPSVLRIGFGLPEPLR